MRPDTLRGRLAGVSDGIQRCAATALLEIRLNLATPALWVMGLVLGAIGYLTVRVQPDPASFPIAWDLNHSWGLWTVVLLIFLAGSLANRPVRYEVTEIQDSKATGSEEIVLGRWLGMVVAVLVPLMLEFGVAMIGQKIHAKPPVQFDVYALAFARSLPPVLFLTSLSFCFVVLTRNLLLGAGLAGLLWMALAMGKPLYPSVLRIELSQNATVFLGLTATVLVTMLLGYQQRRRSRSSLVRPIFGTGALVLFVATCLHAFWVFLALPGKASAAAAQKRLAARHRDGRGPVPNFAWVDSRGRRISLAQFRGRPLFMVFFQPRDGGLAALLERLSTLPADLDEPDLQILGVCLSEDLNGARDVSRISKVGFPLVTDWGGPTAGEFNAREPHSAMAWSLEVSATPLSLLLDDDGRVIKRGLALDERSWDNTKFEIGKALGE